MLREICDLIFQQKDNIDYKIGYALLQTNMQMLKLNVKKAEMWAERGILMCVQWGHSQRILDFLYPKAECHMFFQEKRKAGRLSGKNRADTTDTKKASG